MNNLKLVTRPIAALAKRPGVRTLADHGHGESYVVKRVPSFNDLPVPKGAWKDAYSAKQTRYNALLLFAAVAAVSSASYIFGNGFIDLKANRPDIQSVVKK